MSNSSDYQESHYSEAAESLCSRSELAELIRSRRHNRRDIDMDAVFSDDILGNSRIVSDNKIVSMSLMIGGVTFLCFAGWLNFYVALIFAGLSWCCSHHHITRWNVKNILHLHMDLRQCRRYMEKGGNDRATKQIVFDLIDSNMKVVESRESGLHWQFRDLAKINMYRKD